MFGIDLAIWAFLLSAASAAYGGVSAYRSNKAAAKQAEYNAEYDAKLAANEAEQESMNRAAAEREERAASRRRRALMEGRYAKSGLLLTGTPTDWLSEQAATDEYNAQEGNRVSTQRQTGLLAQADLSRTMGAQQASAFRTAGTTALIQGLGSAASSVAGYSMRFGDGLTGNNLQTAKKIDQSAVYDWRV